MKKNIKKFFNEIAIENNLNLKRKLSWGFYFSNSQSELLKEAKKALETKGFLTFEIYYENRIHYLCIEEICVHTMNSLDKRCTQLESLANKLHIDSFDGFDVEEIE